MLDSLARSWQNERLTKNANRFCLYFSVLVGQSANKVGIKPAHMCVY